jgi:lysophospholipase L1-like esterase
MMNRSPASLVALICCFSVLFLLLHSEGLLGGATTPVKTVVRTVHAPYDAQAHYRVMLGYHKTIDAATEAGAVVFVGDSITQGLNTQAVARSSVNFGIGSDTTQGAIERLPRYASAARARAVVVAIGVNDLAVRSNEQILENYRTIASLIPAHVPVVFSAIHPLDEGAGNRWVGLNPRIKALNSGLEQFTKTSDRLIFANAGAELSDSLGNLRSECHVGDGVHLSAEGYALWIEVLGRAVAEI